MSKKKITSEGFGSYRIALTVILATALCLRLSFVVKASNIPFNYMSDSSMYCNWAKNILAGKEFIGVYHNAPLYPYFLATIFQFFGSSNINVLVVQAILGTLNCFLVYWLSIKLFNERLIGIIAASALAIYGPAIFYDGMLLVATLLTTLSMFFLILLLKAIDSNNRIIWVASGLLCGLCALGRGTILLFIPFLLIFFILRIYFANRIKTDNSKIGMNIIKECVHPLGFFLLGVFIAISPITLRNYIKGKDFVLIAGNAGITFYSGNNPSATGMYMDPPGLDLDSDFHGSKIAGYLKQKELRPSEVSRFWVRQALNFIIENPIQYLKLLGKKFAFYWNRYEIPNAENYYYGKEYFRILQLPLLQFVLVSVLSILGIAISIWRGNTKIYIVLLFAASQIAAIVCFFVTARYRVPLVPLLIIFMCYFIITFTREIKRNKYKGTILWISVSIILFIFVTLPWKELDKKRDFAACYNNIGLLFYISTNNHDKAIQYFEMAIKADPSFVKSYNSLGGILFNIGRNDEALKYWRKGLKINPDYGPFHENFAKYYTKEGKSDKAKQEYVIAAKLQPFSYRLNKIVDGYKKD